MIKKKASLNFDLEPVELHMNRLEGISECRIRWHIIEISVNQGYRDILLIIYVKY